MAYILNNRKKQSLFSQLEMLLESGLDFSRAFRLTISGADKKDTEILSSVFDDVVSGQSLWHAMQRSVTFSPLDYGVVKIGEETNRLDCMLRSQAEAISAELDYEIRQLNNVVEPMMILTIGIIVAFILIAMYLPMFRLGMLIM